MTSSLKLPITEDFWNQSYGSRSVKFPIIYGGVKRSKGMTNFWIKYAQSKTKKFMKGMLIGPLTILYWSFERDDQPRMDTSI